MSSIRFAVPAAFVVLACGAFPAAADTAPRQQQAEGVGNPPPKLKLTDGMFVTVPDRNQVLGVFTVTNNDGAPHMITGFSSPACGTLRMEQWDGSAPNTGPLELTVPSKAKMVFLRGGYHLHCQRPTRSLPVGDQVPVTVTFHGLPAVTTQFEVRPLPQKT